MVGTPLLLAIVSAILGALVSFLGNLFLRKSVAAVEDTVQKISPNVFTQVALGRLVANLMYISNELRSETGPDFARAADAHARSIEVFRKTIRLNTARDIELLKHLHPDDSPQPEEKYLAATQDVLDMCRLALDELERTSASRDETEQAIQRARNALDEASNKAKSVFEVD